MPMSSNQIIELTAKTNAGDIALSLDVDHLIIAGWTGRDKQALEAHIRELQAIGVARPKRTPMFYQLSPALLTTNGEIAVTGRGSTGEVEAVILRSRDRLWVGLGSDQTDRKLETVGVAISKQLCGKPIAPDIWPFDEVRNHWDQLILRSYIYENGTRRLYQEGQLSSMLAPIDLIEQFESENGRQGGDLAMYCGTFAAKFRIDWTDRFDLELEDPVLERTIRHDYRLRDIPIVG